MGVLPFYVLLLCSHSETILLAADRISMIFFCWLLPLIANDSSGGLILNPLFSSSGIRSVCFFPSSISRTLILNGIYTPPFLTCLPLLRYNKFTICFTSPPILILKKGGGCLRLSKKKYVTLSYTVFVDEAKAIELQPKGYAFVSKVGFEGCPWSYTLKRTIKL